MYICILYFCSLKANKFNVCYHTGSEECKSTIRKFGKNEDLLPISAFVPSSSGEYVDKTEDEKNKTFSIDNDPAELKNLKANDRDLLVLKGPAPNPDHFPRDKSGRLFPVNIFLKKLPNNEFISRDWLVWSTKANGLFCFSCCLYKKGTGPTSQLCEQGIQQFN